jgi:hypothetical protein
VVGGERRETEEEDDKPARKHPLVYFLEKYAEISSHSSNFYLIHAQLNPFLSQHSSLILKTSPAPTTNKFNFTIYSSAQPKINFVQNLSLGNKMTSASLSSAQVFSHFNSCHLTLWIIPFI